MDKDIKEQAGPFEKQAAEDLGVSVEEILISEKLSTNPADILAQKTPTIGKRKKKQLEEDKEMEK